MNRAARTLGFAVCALWIALIFVLSSQSYGEQDLRPFLRQHFTKDELRGVLPDVKIRYLHSNYDAHRDPYTFVDFIFRKTAHLFLYGSLAALLFIALRIIRSHALRAALPMTVVITVASLDEWNQTLSASRTGVSTDVILDAAGAVIGIGTTVLIAALRRTKKR